MVLMEPGNIHQVVALLKDMCRLWRSPVVSVVAERNCRPFVVLVSCIISLRTKDQVTAEASERLFGWADTPKLMQKLTVDEIAVLIYPAGFYRNKASQILEISRRLLEDYDGKVPDSIDELLKFTGVGRKTANLVVTLGFGKPGICVDTHVHRIFNRLGYVATKTPEQTEMALRDRLPSEYWIVINDLLVAFGQNCCHPVSPRCTLCGIASFCSRLGVNKFR